MMEVGKRITEEAGLELVVFLATTDDPERHREDLPALCSLSFAEANKAWINKRDDLTPLLSTAPDVNLDLSRQACCAHVNLDVKSQCHYTKWRAYNFLRQTLDIIHTYGSSSLLR